MSGLYRLLLVFLMLGSAGLTYRSAATIATIRVPTLLVERTAEVIAALTDRMIPDESARTSRHAAIQPSG